ncbi:MAG: tellurite resistance TerB family protein [Robiginitomaculum sp.]|nr:tellurite resistance TerB family protein [Robiginitomaculum sp.]
MAQSQLNVQDLLDQFLNSSRELVAQGKEQTKGLTAKGKEIAAKGEDILVDKLGIEDNETSRSALRKGVGAGAAAGALALLLSSRSGRKLALLGGLAGLGTVAYKAYQKNGGTMPKSAQDIIGLLKGDKAEARAGVILQAMIAAAKADGHVNEAELALIKALDKGAADGLEIALQKPVSAREIAALADSEQAAREIYAASARVANGLNPAERDYLDRLAMALNLAPELAARLETDVRTG